MTATVAELAPTVEAAAMACQQIIGSTVLSGMSDPCRVLAPEDMVLASDTTVWRHVVELDRNHQPVTLPALMALAQQDGAVSRYPDGGGEGWHRPYVHAAEETPTSTIPQLVAIIRAASARRQIERDALDIASAARAGPSSSWWTMWHGWRRGRERQRSPRMPHCPDELLCFAASQSRGS